jgi:branched-chain amino acid transport system substrate-binding protein
MGGGELLEVVRVAVEEQGFEVGFIYDSSESWNSTARDLDRSIEFAANPHVIGVVGHAGSGGTLVAAATYQEEGVPNIVPNSTSRTIWNFRPWVFPLVPHDSVEGAFIARHIAGDLGAGSATVFYVSDNYGQGLKEGVVSELSRLGVAVLDEVPIRTPTSGQIESLDPDYESLLDASLARGTPDAAVLATREFAAERLVPLLVDRVPGIHIVGGDALFDHQRMAGWVSGSDGTLEVVDFWDPAAHDSAAVWFRRRFEEITGVSPGGPDATRFDALMLMATAIHEAGADRARVRDYLAALGVSRPPYHGLTGEIRFDRNEGDNLVIVPIGAATP